MHQENRIAIAQFVKWKTATEEFPEGYFSPQIIDAAIQNLGPRGSNVLKWQTVEAAPPPPPPEPKEKPVTNRDLKNMSTQDTLKWLVKEREKTRTEVQPPFVEYTTTGPQRANYYNVMKATNE